VADLVRTEEDQKKIEEIPQILSGADALEKEFAGGSRLALA
jgi:hypothetical protein